MVQEKKLLLSLLWCSSIKKLGIYFYWLVYIKHFRARAFITIGKKWLISWSFIFICSLDVHRISHLFTTSACSLYIHSMSQVYLTVGGLCSSAKSEHQFKPQTDQNARKHIQAVIYLVQLVQKDEFLRQASLSNADGVTLGRVSRLHGALQWLC